MYSLRVVNYNSKVTDCKDLFAKKVDKSFAVFLYKITVFFDTFSTCTRYGADYKTVTQLTKGNKKERLDIFEKKLNFFEAGL